MIVLQTILAFVSMAAVGWITWRLVNTQSEPEGLDSDTAAADPPAHAPSPPAAPDGEADRAAPS